MTQIGKLEAFELTSIALTGGDIPGSKLVYPFYFIFFPVVWFKRNIVGYTSGVKNMLLFMHTPYWFAAGTLAYRLIGKDYAPFAAAVRIASVTRSLISFSIAAQNVKDSVNDLVFSLGRRNFEMQRVHLLAKGKLWNFLGGYPALFCKDILPLIASRFGTMIKSIAILACYSADLCEALTTPDHNIGDRWAAELKCIVEQIGSDEILQALRFHEVWFTALLRKVGINETIEVIAQKIMGK